MSQPDNLGSFLKETKPLLKDYLETRLEIFRLQAVRIASQSAGYMIWIIVSLFILFIIFIFSGIVLGCWLSGLTGSYIMGFGLTTLIFVVIFALLMLFRNSLFINPVMQSVIRKTLEDYDEPESV
jgi:hypothetical protein